MNNSYLLEPEFLQFLWALSPIWKYLFFFVGDSKMSSVMSKLAIGLEKIVIWILNCINTNSHMLEG